MFFSRLSLLVAGASAVAAQSNGCQAGFTAGTDTVLYTAAYTYSQVMSIIGQFGNLTWSGNPDGTVTLNGTDNTVGTARTYNNSGAHVVETLTTYSKPANGPYEEIHVLSTITIPAAGNLMIYADYDGTTVTEVCNGQASAFNFTINFCATNATLAAGVLHMIHLTDAETVTKFLGGENFTTCAALAGGAATTTSALPIATGAAARSYVGGGMLAALGVIAAAVI